MKRFLPSVVWAIFVGATPAQAEPLEAFTGVKLASCSGTCCFQVSGTSAFRSIVRHEYVLEDVEFVLKPRSSKASIVRFRAKSARTNSTWSSWIFESTNGTILFDATSGVLGGTGRVVSSAK